MNFHLGQSAVIAGKPRQKNVQAEPPVKEIKAHQLKMYLLAFILGLLIDMYLVYEITNQQATMVLHTHTYIKHMPIYIQAHTNIYLYLKVQ